MNHPRSSALLTLSTALSRHIWMAQDCLSRATDGNEELGAHESTLRYVSMQLERTRVAVQAGLDLIRDHELESHATCESGPIAHVASDKRFPPPCGLSS